ncbi:MAG: tyrosine-type recombinase/integrase, partial [candidate division WOR-3 bacterium]
MDETREDLMIEARRFLDYIEKEKNYSVQTVRNYRSDLLQFFSYGEDQKWKRIGKNEIGQFIYSLMRYGLDNRSVARKLSTLKSFFNYLIRMGKIDNNPARNIKAPRVKKRLPSFLTITQANEAMAIPPKARDRAMFEVLYSCGLRASELVGLNISDVDLHNCTVRVMGKGRKERIVPIGEKARTALIEYLKERKGETEALFLNYKGGRLTTRSLQRIVRSYLMRLSEVTGT